MLVTAAKANAKLAVMTTETKLRTFLGETAEEIAKQIGSRRNSKTRA